MSDKPMPIFVGSVKEGMYPKTYNIGLSRAHIDLLLQKLEESGKSYVNMQLKHSRKSDKPYMEIRQDLVKPDVNKPEKQNAESVDDGDLTF